MRTGAFIAGMAVAACIRTFARPAAPAPVSASEAGRILSMKRGGDFETLRRRKLEEMCGARGEVLPDILKPVGERR